MTDRAMDNPLPDPMHRGPRPEEAVAGRGTSGRFSRSSEEHEPGRDRPHDPGASTAAAPSRQDAPERENAIAPERPHDGTTGLRHDGESTAAVAPAAAGTVAADTMHAVRRRQREQFGGLHWGAAVFGWLVAFGTAVLLTGLLAAAGAAIGLTELDGAQTETLSLAGGILLVVVALIAYYAGGYVAGRLSRFDGARQGAAVWLLGLLVTAGLALAAAVGGDEYNVVDRANLPRLPVGEAELATGAAIAMAAMLVGTLVAALLGGKAGERYHSRIDRAAVGD